MGGKDLANNVGLALNGRNVVSDTLIYFKHTNVHTYIPGDDNKREPEMD